MTNSYKTVDEFLASLDESTRKQVQTLRKVIMTQRPELVEHIKWNSPSYLFNREDRLTFSVREGFPVKIVLHMGSTRPEDKNAAPVLNDTSGLVEWKSDTRGVVSFKNIDDIERKRKPFSSILEQWLALL